MVRFEETAHGCYKVIVDKQPLGYIAIEHGFFTDSTVIKKFTAVSPNDLRTIADQAESVQKTGYLK